MFRRLRETTLGKFTKVREHNLPILNKGLGTSLAEYAETGPYHCKNCIYVVARNGDAGLCEETHMRKDPEVKKNEKGLAIVNLPKGCCRYVYPQERG